MYIYTYIYIYVLQMTTKGICCHLQVILVNHSVNDSTHISFWTMAMGQFLKPIFPKVYMSTENRIIKCIITFYVNRLMTSS